MSMIWTPMAGIGGGSVVTLSGDSIGDFNGSAGIAEVTLRIGSDGNVYMERLNLGNEQLSPVTDWLRPVVVPENYFVRFTLQSGTGPSDGATLGNWNALSSDRIQTYTQNNVGTRSGTLLVEISPNASAVVASNEYSFTAQVTSP